MTTHHAAPPTPNRVEPWLGKGAGSGDNRASLQVLIVGGLVGVLLAVVLLTRHNSDSSSPSSAAPIPTAPPSLRFPVPTAPLPALPTPGNGLGRTHPAYPSYPAPGHVFPTPAPGPYRTGTCLDGTIPDSTTAVTVHNKVVSCSSGEAHYRVIQSFFGTTDLSRCRSNPATQYAYSSRMTMGGRTISSVVYCLVGIGSYAR